MGITEAITIVFISLKAKHIIDWNWFWVLFPEIIALVVYTAIFIYTKIIVIKTFKEIDESFKDYI